MILFDSSYYNEEKMKISAKNKVLLCSVLIIILTFLSFSSSLDNDFTNWDDDRYVTENHLIRDLSWDSTKIIVATSFKKAYSQSLALLSYSLEYRFFKLNPFIYHLDNVILHILNSLLVFYLIFLLSENVSVSFVSALLFGVHPLHVESVAWVSERKDVLSTFFFLLTVICYLKYRVRERGLYYGIAIIFFAFALLSKAMVVTLPFILFLCDYLADRKFDGRVFLEKIPFFVLSGIFGVINLFVFKSAGAIDSTHIFSLTRNILIAVRGLIFYLAKTIAPFNLSAIYPYSRIVSIREPEFFFSLILFLILIVLLLYSRRYTRKLIFGSLFFFISILPVLKLLPFSGAGAATADRYMYIPSIGLFYMVGVVFYQVYTLNNSYKRERKIFLIVLLGLSITTFSFLTYQRNDVWQNSKTLWSNVIKNYPEALIAYANLGDVYSQEGDLDRSLEEYKKALAYDPNFALAHAGIGLIYGKRGFLIKAANEFEIALKIRPNDSETRNNLANIHLISKKFTLAVKEYEKALKLNPNNAVAHYNIAHAYEEIGKNKLAIYHYRKFIEIAPPWNKQESARAIERIRNLKGR